MKIRFFLLILIPILATAVMLVLFPVSLEPVRTAAEATVGIGSGITLYLDDDGTVLRAKTQETELRRVKIRGCELPAAVARLAEAAYADTRDASVRRVLVTLSVKPGYRETQKTGQEFWNRTLSMAGQAMNTPCNVTVTVTNTSPFFNRTAKYVAVFAPGGKLQREQWIGHTTLRSS